MPTFNVRTDAGDALDSTSDKIDYPNTKAATDDAQVALSDMVREKLPDGKHADFGVSVENDAGKEVYRAGMSFAAKDEDDLDREDREADAAADDVAANLGGKGPRE